MGLVIPFLVSKLVCPFAVCCFFLSGVNVSLCIGCKAEFTPDTFTLSDPIFVAMLN